MKKDSYYFPHDSNARNDVKILKLRRVLGTNGYGIYWMLIEILRETKDYKLPLSSVKDLSFDFRESEEIILSIINDFELFQVDDKYFFFSESLITRMLPLDARKKALSIAGKKGRDKQTQLSIGNGFQARPRPGPGIREDKIRKEDIIKRFNEITGKKIRVFDDKAKRQLNARLKEGFTIEDIFIAVKNCKKDKFHIENPKYLTLEFITRADKLQKYLNYSDGNNKASDSFKQSFVERASKNSY